MSRMAAVVVWCVPLQDALGLLNLELAAAVRTICSDLDASLGPTLQQSSGASSNSNSSCVDPAAHDQLYVVLSLVTSPSLRCVDAF
jgi:hypothetical protein